MDKKNFSDWLKTEKGRKTLIISGIILAALIFLSSFQEPKEKQNPHEKSETELTVVADYERQYEERAKAIIDCIEGVGESKIMITLEGGLEYVYAREEKQKNDITGREGEITDERTSSEKTTILVEDENGNKKALVRTVKEPQVKGVVVVCEGGDDIRVKTEVTEALKTAFGVGTSDVCVAKLKNNI